MKTNRIIFYFLLVILAVSASSCVTPKSVRYLQDMPKDGLPLNKSLEATVAPFDELRIMVLSNTGKDDELLKPFNAVQSMGQSNSGLGGSSMSGYLVDSDGNIRFPVLGELHVEGLTRLQLQDTIAAQLIRNGQLKDPFVIARFLNFKIFLLSSSGGKVINVPNERCTFLEALALAGGLDWYTRRDRIGVMREVDGRRVIHYLDPRSTDIFNDEFFVLQQNDIIFTEERPYKFFNANLNTVLGFISSITGLVTSAVSVVTLYKLFENWTW
ncbi:MAG: polysaccharide biosynthesis/export family protein [Bacteroidales bacterium]|jgi:polysaccharide export outer membrane protein|nr:polysaccharide biosynthesis/export family protein [Bacteroidales bacterium]